MPPASPFWHPVAQSATGAFRYPCTQGYPINNYPCSACPNDSSWKVLKWYTLHVHIQLLMVLILLNDIEKSCVNAGLSECRKKVSPASALLPVVICLSPAKVFRHQGSVRYRRSRFSPALPCPALPISELGRWSPFKPVKKLLFYPPAEVEFQFHLCLSARWFPLSAFCEHDLQSLTIVARVERFCCRTVLIPEKGQGNFFYSLQIAILQILWLIRKSQIRYTLFAHNVVGT